MYTNPSEINKLETNPTRYMSPKPKFYGTGNDFQHSFDAPNARLANSQVRVAKYANLHNKGKLNSHFRQFNGRQSNRLASDLI